MKHEDKTETRDALDALLQHMAPALSKKTEFYAKLDRILEDLEAIPMFQQPEGDA